MQFTQGFHRAVQQRPQQTATLCNDRRRSYAELKDRVARLAAGLCQLGVRDTNRVAMLALNSDHYLEYYLAVPWAGAQLVPLNFRWSVEEIGYALNDCEAVALFVDDTFAPQADALLDACTYVRILIYCGDGKCPEGMVAMEDLIAQNEPMEDASLSNSPLGEEVLGVFYTGGTTGKSKGVLLSHRAVTNSALAFIAEGANVFSSNSVGLHIAPMFHLADAMQTTALILSGGTHVMLPVFRPDAVLDAIQRHHVTDTLLVPAMLQALVDCPALAAHDVSSVRNVLYGASPASESLLDRAMKALPNASFYQGYGMTEVAAVGCILPAHEHLAEGRAMGRLRSAGHAAQQVMVRIVDDQDHEKARGEIGEIVIRGPSLMDGYLNQPEATATALKNGWMHTGDLAYMDDEGFVYIVDRAKDMIVSGGENVYCAEVENAVASHPAVASCAVIGVPDEQLGERVHAVIVLKPGTTLDQAALNAHCRTHIAGYKCPRSLELCDALPMSGAGKVLKTELRKPYWSNLKRQVN
ncbi:MAG: long-chain-fatty-acid--CoA ligase [Nevskiaceae bacterium]|nr:MAG: long-chain-fatty-acid--CoA ligase [Nevskiaceae bacterium]TBR71882.1 MAG: long-chain-fatty-acid--CoA ligase [Nevskiaceae bacterium]